MQLILLKTEDLEKREKTATRIVAMVKKRKEAEKILAKIAKENALDDQWNLIFDRGQGTAGGKRYSYVLAPITENIVNIGSLTIEYMFTFN